MELRLVATCLVQGRSHLASGLAFLVRPASQKQQISRKNDSNEVAMARLGPILGQNEAMPSRIISIALPCLFPAI